MSIKIAHATHDENGKIYGGKAGDQTGGECCIRNWYNRPWNYIIRFKDGKIAEKVAYAMEQAAKNDNIGYDQYQRNTLFIEAKKVGYDPGKVTKKVETDCSALVSLACMYAGIPEDVLYKYDNSSTTSVIRARLVGTGLVDVFTAKQYLNSGDYLLRGDILLYEGHHVAVAIEDGEKATKRQDLSAIQTTQTTPKTSKFTPYIGQILASQLNVRSGPGMPYKAFRTISKGTYVYITEEKGDWGKISDGWISLKYVNKKSSFTGKTTASYLNVREKPIDGDVKKIISKGTTVKINKLNAEGTWGYDTKAKGWVSMKYIKT